MNILMCCGVTCFILSIWGIAQLSLMGVFYKIEAVSLIHDCYAKESNGYDDFISKTRDNYAMTAINCWIAALIYCVVLVLSVFCMRKASWKEELALQKLKDDELSCDPEPKSLKDAISKSTIAIRL